MATAYIGGRARKRTPALNLHAFHVGLGFCDLEAASRATRALTRPDLFTALVSDAKTAIRRRLAWAKAAPRPRLPQ